MQEDIYIKIEAYLGGSMTLEEQNAFGQQLASNPELQQEVSLYDAVNHHLHEESWQDLDNSRNRTEKTTLNTYFKSEEAQQLKERLYRTQQQYNRTQQYPFYKYIAAVAVVLVIGVVSYFSFKQKSYEDLYIAYYTQNDLPSMITRGTSNQILSRGVVAFQNKNHEEALTQLNQYLSKTDEVDPLVYSYIGMSHLELNNPQKAILSFDQLLHTDSIDQSKALWYKCLVYLKNKDITQLKTTLEAILENPSNFNFKKAKKLLEEL